MSEGAGGFPRSGNRRQPSSAKRKRRTRVADAPTEEEAPILAKESANVLAIEGGQNPVKTKFDHPAPWCRGAAVDSNS
jgi:hypothetical protein